MAKIIVKTDIICIQDGLDFQSFYRRMVREMHVVQKNEDSEPVYLSKNEYEKFLESCGENPIILGAYKVVYTYELLVLDNGEIFIQKFSLLLPWENKRGNSFHRRLNGCVYRTNTRATTILDETVNENNLFIFE